MKIQALLLAGAVVLGACGQELEGPAPTPSLEKGTSSLEAAFTDAAREFQVPVEVLKGIAYVETRVSVQNAQTGNGSAGVMAIADRDDWKKLDRAAALTGLDRATLKVDPKANIRGAAAVLREIADKAFADYAEYSAHRLGDWFYVVSLYPGIDSANVANDYAESVFGAIDQGFQVNSFDGSVALAPTSSEWRRHASVAARQDAVKEYPGAGNFIGTSNQSSGRSTYEFVLIHTTQGSFAGTVSWIQNPASNVSAHYVVRSSDGYITQMVEHRNTAWHAQCYNGRSVGIEHEGFVADPAKWYTEAMYNASAKLTRYITDRHGIPRTRSRIIGHVEVAPNCNTSRHSDPGSGWNWTKYMALVNGSTPTETTGVFIGTIYEKGATTNKVAGAVVTAGGKSVTTGADGIYRLNLAPGTYTATVTKAGYSTNSVSRMVTAGAQIWGSMEINAVATATGKLTGKVHAYNMATPGNTDAVISGATITIAGQPVQTTGADGKFSFTLPAGTYSMVVAKTGFANNTVSRAVTAGGTVDVAIPLTPAGGADVLAPMLAISFPENGAKLDTAVQTVSGTASDDRGAVAKVLVSLNAGAPTEATVTGGKFSVDVKLKAGTNTIKVTAKDAAGNEGSATSTAIFTAGVAGFVHEAGDEAARIAGAKAHLLLKAANGSSMKVSETTADATGAFTLPVMTAPADYILVVQAPGYQLYTETFTASDEEQSKVEVPMVKGGGEIPEFSVRFAEPADGATVSTPTITVSGSVSGFELASVKVNGVDAELPAVTGFIATVPLVEGANVIEAVATGVAGETVKGKITVTRRAGGINGPGGENNQTKGGCSTVAGLELLALGVVAPLLRRRRR